MLNFSMDVCQHFVPGRMQYNICLHCTYEYCIGQIVICRLLLADNKYTLDLHIKPDYKNLYVRLSVSPQFLA